MKYSIVKRILALTFASSLILTGCTGENPVPGTAGVDTGANTTQANSDSTDENPAVDSAYSDSADSSDSDLTADAASTEAYTSGKYPITWNIDAVYKNDEEFLKDGELIKGWISKLSDYKGTLSDASTIKEFYKLIWDDDIRAVYGRMMTYVNMRLTMDSSDTKAGELDALLSEYDSGFIAATAFADDEIFTMDPAKRATVFGDRIFDDMTFLREKFANESDSHHSEDAINLMGKISNASGYGLKAYNEFLNNSFPYCNYTLPDGRTVPLTAASRQYIAAGSDYDRDVKIEVYDAYYQNLASYNDILAIFLEDSIAGLKVKADYEGADSIKSYCLKDNDFIQIHDNIINAGHAASSCLKEDFKIKSKVLGVDMLYPFEYTQGISGYTPKSYTYDEAVDLIRESLMPLGADYIALYDEYVKSGNIFASNDGRSRGMSYTKLDSVKSEPYIYIDFYGSMDDVKTLAHEIGHAMHYKLSKENTRQCDFSANALTSEIPSAVNEYLLINYMIDHAGSNEEKIYCYEQLLDAYFTNYVTQIIYAQLEDYIIATYEEKGALSGEDISSREQSLKSDCYGDLYANYASWANVAHLHYGYYLYTYPASFAYSMVLCNEMLDGENETVEKYYDFLKTSGDNAVKQLKVAGIDPLGSDVYDSVNNYYGKTIELYRSITE